MRKKIDWIEYGGNMEYDPSNESFQFAIIDGGKVQKTWSGLKVKLDDSEKEIKPTHYRVVPRVKHKTDSTKIHELLMRESVLYKYIREEKGMTQWMDIARELGMESTDIYNIFMRPLNTLSIKQMLRLKRMLPELEMSQMLNMLLPRVRGWWEFETWEHDELKERYRNPD